MVDNKTKHKVTETDKNILRENFIKAGVKFIDADTVYLSEDTIIGSNVTIEPFVVIGKEVVIDDNVYIKAFCHIEKTHIKAGATVGPFTRLRNDTVIGENSFVSNFVEMRNVQTENGVQVNHFSFLGDTTIGEKTNIGAGTVTCNYDGFNKNFTTIGRDVFVGSNSSLVAPLGIKDRAIIAAGSTITNDVGEDDMAIARSRQETKAGAAKRFREKKKKV